MSWVNIATINTDSDYNLSPYFLQGFRYRKNAINQDKKSIASYHEQIDKIIPDCKAELEKKIPDLKDKINKIKTKKESIDRNRTITQSVCRIVKIAALLLGYTLLGVGSLGIIPMVIECSSSIFKKTYLGKLGYKLFKNKSELNSLKKQIACQQTNLTNYKSCLKNSESSLKNNEDNHQNDIKMVEKLIKDLESKQKKLFTSQNYLVEQISKQPDDCLTFQGQLAKTSKDLYEVIQKIDSFKNLIS